LSTCHGSLIVNYEFSRIQSRLESFATIFTPRYFFDFELRLVFSPMWFANLPFSLGYIVV
jgi:hypothetical protein